MKEGTLELDMVLECRLARVRKGGKMGIWFPASFKSKGGILAPCKGIKIGETRIVKIVDTNDLGWIGEVAQPVVEEPKGHTLVEKVIKEQAEEDGLAELIRRDFGTLIMPEPIEVPVDLPDYDQKVKTAISHINLINQLWQQLTHKLIPIKEQRDAYKARLASLPKAKLTGDAAKKVEAAKQAMAQGYHQNAQAYNDAVRQLTQLALSMGGIKMALEETIGLIADGVVFEIPPCPLLDEYRKIVVPVTGGESEVEAEVDPGIGSDAAAEQRAGEAPKDMRLAYDTLMDRIQACVEALDRHEDVLTDAAYLQKGEETVAVKELLAERIAARDNGAQDAMGKLDNALKNLAGRVRYYNKVERELRAQAEKAEQDRIEAEAKAKAEENKRIAQEELAKRDNKGATGKVKSRKPRKPKEVQVEETEPVLPEPVKVRKSRKGATATQ